MMETLDFVRDELLGDVDVIEKQIRAFPFNIAYHVQELILSYREIVVKVTPKTCIFLC